MGAAVLPVCCRRAKSQLLKASESTDDTRGAWGPAASLHARAKACAFEAGPHSTTATTWVRVRVQVRLRARVCVRVRSQLAFGLVLGADRLDAVSGLECDDVSGGCEVAAVDREVVEKERRDRHVLFWQHDHLRVCERHLARGEGEGELGLRRRPRPLGACASGAETLIAGEGGREGEGYRDLHRRYVRRLLH